MNKRLHPLHQQVAAIRIEASCMCHQAQCQPQNAEQLEELALLDEAISDQVTALLKSIDRLVTLTTMDS